MTKGLAAGELYCPQVAEYLVVDDTGKRLTKAP